MPVPSAKDSCAVPNITTTNPIGATWRAVQASGDIPSTCQSVQPPDIPAAFIPDQINPLSIKMIGQVAALDRQRDDIRPEGGDAFAPRIPDAWIDQAVRSTPAQMPGQLLRLAIILRRETGRKGGLTAQIMQPGSRRPDQFAHLREPARGFCGGPVETPLVPGGFSDGRLELARGIIGAEGPVMEPARPVRADMDERRHDRTGARPGDKLAQSGSGLRPA